MDQSAFFVAIPELLPTILTPASRAPQEVEAAATTPSIDLTSVRRVPAGEKAYTLPDFTAAALEALSSSTCKLCSKGVNGWRTRGRVATVCKCVRANAQMAISGYQPPTAEVVANG